MPPVYVLKNKYFMLDRSDIMDSDLVARLSFQTVPGPPSPFPHRGIHSSPRRGASLEFSEHAEYTPGEDVRDMDWKVYAKSDRYFLKRYEDERLQRAFFLLDASNSMRYGAAAGELLKGSKFHTAARIAAALASKLIHQGDAVGLGFAGEEENSFLSPRAGRHQFEAIIDLLCSGLLGGRARLKDSWSSLGERLRSGAAVFILSDFLDHDPDDLEELGVLAARGIKARMIHLLHRDEVDLPFENTTRFPDMEGPDFEVLDPDAVRTAYMEEITGFARGLASAADSIGIPHAFIVTDEDPVPAISELLRQSARR